MEMCWYILDSKGRVVKTHSLAQWGFFFNDVERRRVAHDCRTVLGEDVRVSTVFLGLDHGFGRGGPPVLWETMIFGGLDESYMSRYSSRADALTGHRRALRRAEAPAKWVFRIFDLEDRARYFLNRIAAPILAYEARALKHSFR